jgi:hypothetical protein
LTRTPRAFPHDGRGKRRLIVWTIILWVFGAVAYAHVYVVSRISLPDALGYDADWSWQLFFFALVRAPLLIVGLVVALYLEHVLWPTAGHHGNHGSVE